MHKALLITSGPQEARAALVAVGQQHVEARPVAALFEAVRSAVPAGDYPRARGLVSWIHEQQFDPALDPFVRKYLPDAQITLGIADGVTVTLPLDRDTVGLLLAELMQRDGDLDLAVSVVEGLNPTSIAAVSLAELYIDQQAWAQVVDLTETLTNEDDLTTFLLIQRGVALRELGYPGAAREALKEALRVRSRPTELRHRAWLERGNTYIAEGKRALARKDLERVLAENSLYPGLKEALDRLPG